MVICMGEEGRIRKDDLIARISAGVLQIPFGFDELSWDAF